MIHTLQDFFTKQIYPRRDDWTLVNVLELGANGESLFSDEGSMSHKYWPKGRPQSVLSLDLRHQDIYDSKKHVYYRKGDAGEKCDGQFDIVFDAHCLHCIVEEEHYQKALTNICNALSPGGFFCAEMMISHSKMSFLLPLYFDSRTHRLCLQDKGPIRRILPAHLIEEELLRVGFKLQYFYCLKDQKFSFDNNSLALESGPDVLRFIATKE